MRDDEQLAESRRLLAPHRFCPALRLGFIAEEMPKDVLSPNGKGVDTYELVTFMAGAIKAQQARIDRLEARLIA